MMTARLLLRMKSKDVPETPARNPYTRKQSQFFYKGEMMGFHAMSALPECQVHADTIRYRVRELGWTVESAVTTPVLKRQGALTQEQSASIIQDHKNGVSMRGLMKKHKVGKINLKLIIEEAA